jgi:23S rRNA (cytosine1962-C5)-methyltransferase
MELSKMNGIKWVVEDAFKFVSREAKRGNTYNGIILDPPAYGRGPNGERWILEDAINSLLKECKQILSPNNSFVLLNMYSKGFSVLVADSLCKSIFHDRYSQLGELCLSDRDNRRLPLGGFVRLI